MSVGSRLRKKARELLKREDAKNETPSRLASQIQINAKTLKKSPQATRENFLVRYGRFEESEAVNAFLVIPGDVEDQGQEIVRLTESLGLQVYSLKFLKEGRRITSATFIGEGTIDDIHKKMEGIHDPILIIDAHLSPGQTRNLENALKMPVLDRHILILAIFKRNAKSHVAKLQVELAELQILKSRLTGVWEGLSRQRGAAGGKSGRGQGETRLELDRRTLRKRIDIIRGRLKTAEKSFQTQSKARSQFPRVALVGYTNAGKSSLMQKLTQSEVLVEDRLFATLDTTVRTLQPQTNPKILISDTVGFVRSLPTELVASFKSTLMEALSSDLLLHVVDISDPRWKEQIEVTEETLEEIGAGDIPVLYVFNKMDLLESVPRLRGSEIRRYLGAKSFVMTSALNKEGCEGLRNKIMELTLKSADSDT